MKYGFILLLLSTNFLLAQKAILTDAVGQPTTLAYGGYDVKAGRLTLLDKRQKPVTLPAGPGYSIVLEDGLRFVYFDYFKDKPGKAGYYQQLTNGALLAYDLGGKGILVKASSEEELLLVPLSSNTPMLTYLLRKCSTFTAESLEQMNTKGLNNLLEQIHAYNRCIDEGSAELLFRPTIYSSPLKLGPIAGIKGSSLNPLDREETLREAQGSHTGPVLGFEVRKRIGRSPVGLRGQILLHQMNIKNDSLPILFNSNTFEKYEIKSMNLQFNLLGAFHLRDKGFLTSLFGGLSPRLNLNYEFTREVFGSVILANEYVGRKEFGIGLVGGIGVYEKKLRSGGAITVQAQVDSYKQYLYLSDGSEPGYREVKWSVLAGYLF